MLEKLKFLLGLYSCMLLAFFVRIRYVLFPLKKNKGFLKIAILENQTSDHAGAYYRAEILKDYFPQNEGSIQIFYPYSKEEFNGKNSLTLLLKHIFRKFSHILTSANYDIVIVRRELLHQCQYGGLIFEKLLLSIHPNAILDMDDYMPDLRKQEVIFSLFNILSFHTANKVNLTIPLFKYHTLATPEFKETLLVDFPNLLNENIHIFPMCLNYSSGKKKVYVAPNTSLGWVSRKDVFYRIDNLTSAFNAVYQKYPFSLVIVSDAPYENKQLLVPVINKKWSIEDEVEQILSFDIGIAPIDVDSTLKNRKGTFKMVQYMGLGVVSITSELSYSKRIIEEGVNGFLVGENQTWEQVILAVLNKKPNEMKQIAERAYETFYKSHHIETQSSQLFNFYKYIAINSYCKNSK